MDKNMEERIAEIYYTAAEARAVLGMSKDSFNYWVRIGKIQKRTLMGGKQGVYARKDIDALAARIEAMMLADTPEPLTFRRATIDDLDTETYLAYLIFGQRALDPDMKAARRAYLERCPDSAWHLYDNERLVSYINIVPVSDQAIEDFTSGKNHAWAFSSEVRPFVPEKKLQCIIADFVTIPSAPPAKRSVYAERVLLEISHVLRDFAAQGIEITKVYAASATASGQRILKNAGFVVISNPTKDRFIYQLDVPTATHLKMLQEYREALEEWRQKHLG